MTDTPELTTAEFSTLAESIEQEVGRVIVGQRDVVRSVLTAVIVGRHVLLEGVPGLGKTLLIRTLADVLDLKFSRIQFTPDLMPSDIVGTDILSTSAEGGASLQFRPGPIFANLILADEINRATPKTQSAMLEAMQEKRVTVGNQTYTLEPPFFVLATQNPIEQEGTYPLPEAQLDRFMLKVDVLSPNAEDLAVIMERTTGAATPTASAVVSAAQLLAMRQLALNVPVSSDVTAHIARLIVATHPHSEYATDDVNRWVRYGSSPRGAQAIVLAAKVNALLSGRFNVSFDDVRAVAPSALRHRLPLNYEGMAEGVQSDALITALIDGLPKPR